MPFLTKISINPHREGSVKLLGDPHLLHGAVVNGFPTDPRNERLLWRLETTDRFRPVVLVLSQSHPDYTALVQNHGWPNAPAGAPVTKDYTPLLERLSDGQGYRFRLTANPVQNTRKPDKLTAAQQQRQAAWDAKTGTAAERGARGHRVAHRTVAHQRQWLLACAAKRGFAIPAVMSNPSEDTSEVPDGIDYQVVLVERKQLHFNKGRSAKPVNLSSVTFEGILHITDTDLFKQALLQGIGPAKAYGQGLLTLAPLETAGI